MEQKFKQRLETNCDMSDLPNSITPTFNYRAKCRHGESYDPAAGNLLVVLWLGQAEAGDPRDELLVGTGAALPAYVPQAFQPPKPGIDRMFLEY